jgi:hypothetical protein
MAGLSSQRDASHTNKGAMFSVQICIRGGRTLDARAKFWPRCRTPKNEAHAPHLLIDLLNRDEGLQ